MNFKIIFLSKEERFVILQFFSCTGNPNCGQDDEDIDIVGDHGGPPKNKNHNTSSMSSHSNEGSADGNTNHRTSLSRGEFQTGIYGPPQFTEADVLACMTEAEKEDEGRNIFCVEMKIQPG